MLIFSAALHWGHIVGSSVQAPQSRHRDSVIQNQVPHLKKKMSFSSFQHHTQKYTEENKCIMYNTFHGHFNPKRRFVTRVEYFFFFFLSFPLLFGITVCVTIPQHQGLNVRKQRKIQPIVTHFKFWGKGFISPFTLDSSVSAADGILDINMYTARLRGQDNTKLLPCGSEFPHKTYFRTVGSTITSWPLVIFSLCT